MSGAYNHKNMVVSSMAIPALERPFTLGLLYDSNSSTLIVGPKLWTKKEIEAMIEKRPISSMKCGFFTESSLSKSSDSLKVDGNMSLSLFRETYSVSGSGSYFTESSKNSDTESVIYVMEIMSDFEELNLKEAKLHESQLFGASHVVSGIQYGGTARFIFKRNKTDSKSKKDFSGKFEAKLSFLLSVSGSLTGKLTNEEIEEMQNISVVYTGDFHINSPPTNLQEALKCIQSLKSAEASAPMTVYLTPLSCLLPPENYLQDAVPIPKESQERSIDCYKLLMKAMKTVEQVIAALRPTLWTLAVKQLEATDQELQKAKTCLDVAVNKALHSDSTSAQETHQLLETTLTKFQEEFPKVPLLTWLNSISQDSMVLVEISNKFKEIGVLVISREAQKARFLMSNDSKELFIISACCPSLSLYTASSGSKQIAELKLWEIPNQDRVFYSKVKNLENFIKDKAVCFAAEQVENADLKHDIQLKYETRKNGEWVEISI